MSNEFAMLEKKLLAIDTEIDKTTKILDENDLSREEQKEFMVTKKRLELYKKELLNQKIKIIQENCEHKKVVKIDERTDKSNNVYFKYKCLDCGLVKEIKKISELTEKQILILRPIKK